MARTVEQIARDVLASIDTTAGHLLCAQWVAKRYRQLCSRTRFRHLREIRELVIPAIISAGTVSGDAGSDLLIGDATAQAAWTGLVWSGAPRHVRFGTTTPWFEVVGPGPGGTLRLNTPLLTALAASGYYLAQRYVALASGTRWLGDFVHPRLRMRLDSRLVATLDYEVPARERIGMAPQVYADVGALPDGRRLFEFYPMSTQDELILYVVWADPPTLAFNDPVPPMIPDHVLIEGALIDAMRFEQAKAARSGQVEMAAFWRNEYRAQATTWERDILDAIRADRGVDDVTLILQGYGQQRPFTDQRTARDVAYDRWPS